MIAFICLQDLNKRQARCKTRYQKSNSFAQYRHEFDTKMRRKLSDESRSGEIKNKV
jgi:hypothetical protein